MLTLPCEKVFCSLLSLLKYSSTWECELRYLLHRNDWVLYEADSEFIYSFLKEEFFILDTFLLDTYFYT